MTQNNLGAMFYNLNAYDKAEKAYVETLEIRKRLSQTNPDRYKPEVAGLFGGLSWLFLLAKKFEKAEESAIQGLKWDPSQEWINTNLAHAILFQGRYEEAEALYSTLKTSPFNDTTTYGEAFLQDLKAFEEKGITHPDVERIRTLLL
jgi:tetratricopeptide (TPR) repeat protein